MNNFSKMKKEVVLGDFSIGENYPRVKTVKSYSLPESLAFLEATENSTITTDLQLTEDEMKDLHLDVPLDNMKKSSNLQSTSLPTTTGSPNNTSTLSSTTLDKMLGQMREGETVITVDLKISSKTDVQFTCYATIIGITYTLPFLVSDLFLDANLRFVIITTVMITTICYKSSLIL
jgi:Ca2+-dependent lipid-binding protein